MVFLSAFRHDRENPSLVSTHSAECAQMRERTVCARLRTNYSSSSSCEKTSLPSLRPTYVTGSHLPFNLACPSLSLRFSTRTGASSSPSSTMTTHFPRLSMMFVLSAFRHHRENLFPHLYQSANWQG